MRDPFCCRTSAVPLGQEHGRSIRRPESRRSRYGEKAPKRVRSVLGHFGHRRCKQTNRACCFAFKLQNKIRLERCFSRNNQFKLWRHIGDVKRQFNRFSIQRTAIAERHIRLGSASIESEYFLSIVKGFDRKRNQFDQCQSIGSHRRL